MNRKKQKKTTLGSRAPWLALLVLVAIVGWQAYTIQGKQERQAHAQASSHQTQEPSIAAPTGEVILGDTTLLELPQLSGGAHNYFVTHYAEGQVNYSLEYDTQRRHARWVAFSFDRASAPNRVKRSDAWGWDPKLPKEYSTDNWFARSGYSRGHLVASEDRTFAQEANEQTFYYSNISPQLQEHNGGVWVRLEKKVQSWGRDERLHDVLYVAKGGTIRDDQIEEHRLRGQIVIPRYYWMALLLQKGDEYHSIAFWTEHRSYAKGEGNLRDLAISVDELEQRTGLNLFYRLPTSVAQHVEAEDPNGREARRIWWR
ncbi:DNA/RNA non-specific endonuclease [Porphyromonas sp. COT-290 OH3588]|uniref:DNA/RNA non-specific endonuclease n=1 Tax=Porphyromonas sp. COT-290 OH3588 TaxID=1515617 RepID=UPI0006934EAE|nr:DNA/RNA non-specific endonuclease [Porphyromonas sp. COT-290 OH3588]